MTTEQGVSPETFRLIFLITLSVIQWFHFSLHHSIDHFQSTIEQNSKIKKDMFSYNICKNRTYNMPISQNVKIDQICQNRTIEWRNEKCTKLNPSITAKVMRNRNRKFLVRTLYIAQVLFLSDVQKQNYTRLRQDIRFPDFHVEHAHLLSYSIIKKCIVIVNYNLQHWAFFSFESAFRSTESNFINGTISIYKTDSHNIMNQSFSLGPNACRYNKMLLK